LVSGGADKRIVVWDLQKGAARHTLEGHSGSVTAVAVSPNGQQILAGTGTIWSRPGELRLWDLNSGKHIRTMEGHGDSIFSVDWSGDGKFAISGSADKTAILWELSTGKRAHTLEGHTDSVLAACMAGDGRFALTGSKDGTLRLWTLDWDLGERPVANWDDGALPYLEQFVALTPPHKRSGAHETAHRQSSWSKDELALLYYQLGCAGYGWVPPAEVERRLTQLAGHRSLRPTIPPEKRRSGIFRRLRGD
jgi:WD40 repeat protein